MSKLKQKIEEAVDSLVESEEQGFCAVADGRVMAIYRSPEDAEAMAKKHGGVAMPASEVDPKLLDAYRNDQYDDHDYEEEYDNDEQAVGMSRDEHYDTFMSTGFESEM